MSLGRLRHANFKNDSKDQYGHIFSLTIMTLPTLFLTHGGGPMPLLGQQVGIAKHIQQIAATVQRPKAILIVSGHWEVSLDPHKLWRSEIICSDIRGCLRSLHLLPLQEERPTVTTSPRPPMLFDYYGFPPEASVGPAQAHPGQLTAQGCTSESARGRRSSHRVLHATILGKLHIRLCSNRAGKHLHRYIAGIQD